jgi:3-oxoacyl-[acyl-carrier protein] reductase
MTVSSLAGRVAIVTGASSGIGRVCCETLARHGARIVAVGRDRTRLEHTAALARAAGGGPEPLVLPLDVTREADMAAMAQRTLDAAGRIDILVHSAGLLRRPGTSMRTLVQLGAADFDEVIDVNLRGTFLANRAVLPAMVAARAGDIVNLASRSGRVGIAFDAPYCASKFGVVALTEAVADEARAFGVRVQALLPGQFATEVLQQMAPLPPPDVPPPQRVADAVAWMLALPGDARLLSPIVDPISAPTAMPWFGVLRSHHPARRSNNTTSRGPGPMNAPAITRAAQDLRGKVIVITGGAGGIGLATARMVGELGASVVIADLDPARVDSAAADLARGPAAAGGCLGVAMDVRLEDDHARLVQRSLDRFGRIDALIACAGILRLRGTPPKLLVDTTTEEFDQVVGINLRGIFLANRAVLPTMVAQRSGMIINLSSVQGLQGRAYDSVYCASKAGVIGLTQAVAEEVRSFGIKVQALMPAAVATPMWEQNKPAPMPGDAIAPERVAEVIAFMLLQPEDTMLVGPVIAPVGARKRKGA